MKYIVLSRDIGGGRKQELPFMFPEDVLHADMAAALSLLFRGVDMRIVATGEAIFVSAPRCFGRSVSLGKESRGQVDAALFQVHDYRHGLVDGEGSDHD